jgi:hypothetical protein
MGFMNSVRLASLLLIGEAALFSASASAGPIEDMAPGTWYEVPNSKLSSVDPCPARNCGYSGNEGQAAVIDDWTGAAVATGLGSKGSYIVWGGGHGGYLGSEVYAFDVATLKWSRLSNPVTSSCEYNEAELSDGSRCSAHTYDGVDYHPGTNSFVIIGAAGSHEGITASPRVHLFNLSTKQWRRGQRYPGGGAPWGGGTAYDASRDVFWVLPGFNMPIGKYDPNSDSWTTYGRYNIDTDSVGSIDPTRDLFVVLDGQNKHQIVVVDLKNPNGGGVVVPFTGDSTPLQRGGNGFDWDPVQKVFVAWAGGDAVYTLKPPSGDWRTGNWVWTKVNPSSSNTVQPTARNSNGPWSHWRYVPSVNAWMIVNRTTDNVFFYKMTSGGGTTQPTPAVTPNAPSDVRVN